MLHETDFEWHLHPPIQREVFEILHKAVTGEAAPLDAAAKRLWEEKMLPRLLDKCADRDVYNGDETGLFFQLLPPKTPAIKRGLCEGGHTVHCTC